MWRKRGYFWCPVFYSETWGSFGLCFELKSQCFAAKKGIIFKLDNKDGYHLFKWVREPGINLTCVHLLLEIYLGHLVAVAPVRWYPVGASDTLLGLLPCRHTGMSGSIWQWGFSDTTIVTFNVMCTAGQTHKQLVYRENHNPLILAWRAQWSHPPPPSQFCISLIHPSKRILYITDTPLQAYTVYHWNTPPSLFCISLTHPSKPILYITDTPLQASTLHDWHIPPSLHSTWLTHPSKPPLSMIDTPLQASTLHDWHTPPSLHSTWLAHPSRHPLYMTDTHLQASTLHDWHTPPRLHSTWLTHPSKPPLYMADTPLQASTLHDWYTPPNLQSTWLTHPSKPPLYMVDTSLQASTLHDWHTPPSLHSTWLTHPSKPPLYMTDTSSRPTLYWMINYPLLFVWLSHSSPNRHCTWLAFRLRFC